MKSLVRIILAEQTVEVAAVEEYGKVVVSDFRSCLASVLWIAHPGPGWAEPSGAAVGDLRIQIVVQSSLVRTRIRSEDTARFGSQSAVTSISLTDQTLVGAESTRDASHRPWGACRQAESSSNVGVRFCDVRLRLLVIVPNAVQTYA